MVFLALADRGYPKRLVFAYLADVHRAFAEELAREFGPTWRQQLGVQSRPYAFLKFDKSLHRLRVEYADPSSKANTSKLMSELNDVQSIARRNITELLDRGERLESAC